MNPGSSPACVRRDTSCKAPGYARVSIPPQLLHQLFWLQKSLFNRPPQRPISVPFLSKRVIPLPQILTNVKQGSISVLKHRPVWTSTDGTSVWTRTGAKNPTCRCPRSECLKWELPHTNTRSLLHTSRSQLLKYVAAITPLNILRTCAENGSYSISTNYFFHTQVQLATFPLEHAPVQ